MKRREFLSLLMAGGAVAHARPNAEPDFIFRQEDKKGFSILQGMTDERSTQLSLVLPKSQAWTLEVAPTDASPHQLVTATEVHVRPYSPDSVHRLDVKGLQLGKTYVLRVKDAVGRVHDEREFRALDLSARAVRLAFVSCAFDAIHRDDIWNRLHERQPDLVFFLGDNVYADKTSLIFRRAADEEQFWKRYVATRQRVQFYFQKALRPVLAIWDDHDFGANNSDRTFPHKDAAKRTFETFFAQRSTAALTQGPGIARRLQAFGADFYLLDGRYFRDVLGQAGRRLLGASQEKWLFQNIQARTSFLLNGSMFYGAYTEKDSFEGLYKDDFTSFIGRLKASEGLFCFGAGDVHFSEVQEIERQQLGYSTFELVSSSIHSGTFPGHEHRFTNPRRRASTSSHNFVIFEGEFGEDTIQGEIAAYSSRAEDFRTAIQVRR